ncbi:MAG: hypothetical protein ACHQIG_02155 [Acidimicrobiia bacterium]
MSDARRFHRGSLAGGLLALLVLTWLATRGFSTLFDRPPFADFYDAQARSLFHGHWNMPKDVLSFERFNIGGRYYTYFGPTPAFLRMPVLLFTDGLDGRLSRLSTIAACAVLVWSVARLSWLARRTVRGDRPVSRGEQFVAAGVVVVGGLGTVTPYLAGWTQVYHEAIIWAVAFALVSYGALVAWLLDGRTRDLVVAGVAAALSVLARGSVGFGPIAALGIVAAVRGWAALRERRAGSDVDVAVLGVLAAVVLVPVLAYGYVNWAKFGAAFAAPPFGKQDLLVRLRPSRAAAMADNGGSLFGVRYAPTVLYHYFRPDGVTLDGLFPWVLPRVPTRVFGGAVFEALLPTTSVTAASPLALIVALVGGVVAIARTAARTVWLAPVIGVAIGAVGAVSLAFVDQRYQGDFVPLLVVPGVLGAWMVVEWVSGRSRAIVAVVATLAVALGAWSVWVNVAVAYVFQRTQTPYSTVDDRASLVDAQLRVRELLGGGLPAQVSAGAELPATGSAGDLFVLGDCDGVYRYDGISWLPVEQTGATGYFPVVVHLDRGARGRQPVLSSVDDTGTTVLWARNEQGGDRVGFEYQWEPSDPANRFATRIPLGAVDRGADGSVVLSTRIDPRAGISDVLQVRAGGHLLFQDIVNKLHGPVELGVQRTLPGATSLAGDIQRRTVRTPICDRLVDLGLRLP